LESVLAGVAALVVGGLVATYGVRVFYLLLPLWGFLSGFVLGAQGVATLLNEGFLATVVGWGAGIALGAVFAVTAILWVWAAVLVLAFTVGSTVGSGLLIDLGLNPGILPFAAGLALGVALVVVAIAIDGPTLLVAILTSFGGAAWVVAGALLVLGALEIADLSSGAIGALRDAPLAIVGWLVVAVAALVVQLQEARGGLAGLRLHLDQPVA
jgi:hypothetical protein